MNRRKFIGTGLMSAAFLSAGLQRCQLPRKKIGGTILNNGTIGHLLRDGVPAAEPKAVRYTDVLIIGAGVSGLSAARELHRQGIADFLLLEVEQSSGGNAAFGQNEHSAFPLGAHYVPTPNNDLQEYLDFLYEAGVITGYNKEGLPVYNELFLCMDQQERLFINGNWQNGLIPHLGLQASAREEFNRFLQMMETYRNAKGVDDKFAFNIPIDTSSNDTRFARLDKLTMKEWMLSNDFTLPELHWYVNYACRDDFGTHHEDISAWAGIHYFACRKGRGDNAIHTDVLTWPEGNGFLVKALTKHTSANLITKALAYRVEQKANGVIADYYEVATGDTVRIQARHCIMAVPQFIAARLLQHEERKQLVKQQFTYTPWLVANIKTRELPLNERTSMAWDNVVYNSASLGYVDATHQLPLQDPLQKNLTYYHAFGGMDAAAARQALYTKDHPALCEAILLDLETAHSGIRALVKEINIKLWGHAMVQPHPGIIKGELRSALAASIDNIHFAHTDLAGVSIFEEAFYQGIYASRKVLAGIHRTTPQS